MGMVPNTKYIFSYCTFRDKKMMSGWVHGPSGPMWNQRWSRILFLTWLPCALIMMLQVSGDQC